MREIEARFRDHFAPWGITILSEHVRERRRGKIVEAGWAIWYLFGEDERGQYLDYYAAHRMSNNRHIRICEDGSEERLPTVSTMRIVSPDPEEDARLAAEHLEENRRVAQMLEEKGFRHRGRGAWRSSDKPLFGALVSGRLVKMFIVLDGVQSVSLDAACSS